MPRQVIERLVRYQTHEHANIHRGVHYLSETATAAFEAARHTLARFINAREEREVIFTSNCTDGINLVMQGYGRKYIGAGDEIIIDGFVHGDVNAKSKVTLSESGRLVGNVISPKFEIRFGAHFEGKATTAKAH